MTSVQIGVAARVSDKLVLLADAISKLESELGAAGLTREEEELNDLVAALHRFRMALDSAARNAFVKARQLKE